MRDITDAQSGRQGRPTPSPGWRPSVSVVMPARNEGESIEPALRSIMEQDYPHLREIVVADGMSTDQTRAIVARLAATDARVRLIDNPARSTPVGLNAAIRASSGDVIVRCDGHAVLPPGYVTRSVHVMGETGADNVGGMQVATGRTLVQRAIARAMSSRMGVGDARFHLGGKPGPVDTVYLGVFRRDALERVGLFDEALKRNQDSELNFRLRATGGTVYFDPDLRVAYEPRASLGALWRQYFTSGAWKRETFRRHPRSVRWRQMAPPILVLSLVFSVAIAFTPYAFAGAFVPGLYLAALLLASLWTLVRRLDPSALLLPVVLPVMHVAWGTGLLIGRSGVEHHPVPAYSQAKDDGYRVLIKRRVVELINRRQVLARLVGEDLKVKYEGSVLGYVWSVLEPLLLTGVYWFVFAVLFKGKTTGIRAGTSPYQLFLIIGLLPWSWFNSTMTAATKALTSNAKLITKVHIPREIFPLSLVVSQSIEYVLSLGVLVIFALGSRTLPSGFLVFFPLAFLIQFAMLAGLTMMLSVFNTLLRDTERIIRPALRVMFYVSPVLYPLKNVSSFGWVVKVNPLVGIFELMHASFYPQLFQGWGPVLYSAIVAGVMVFLGWATFLRLEPAVLKEL